MQNRYIALPNCYCVATSVIELIQYNAKCFSCAPPFCFHDNQLGAGHHHCRAPLVLLPSPIDDCLDRQFVFCHCELCFGTFL